jgi:dTDP-4-dehydrorhamnose reductase
MTKPLQVWGGVECTINRVHDRYFDQAHRSGHFARVDDIARFAGCGLSALRCPVLWEHVAPTAGGERRWESPDLHLQRIRELGITPIVGLLHHGSGPRYTSLIDERFPERFAAYARTVAERYPWVTDWTPINEPLTTARFSALYGHWFPHQASDSAFVRALLNQLRGTVLAMREIRAVNTAARLVQTDDAGVTSGTGSLAAQVEHERERRWLSWDVLAGRVDRDHPLWRFLVSAGASPAELDFFRDRACIPDVIGLNYYLTSDRWLDENLERYPESSHGGNGTVRYADVEIVRARPEGITGHERHLVAAWQRYGRTVAITETHLGCSRDEQMRWLVEAWRGAHAARARGADVEAITAWALLGSFDWDSLVTKDRGHYEPGLFDMRAPVPRPTALVKIVTQMASGEQPSHPVLAGKGWWRRPDRLLFDSAKELQSGGGIEGPVLLIVGGRGTLVQACQRVCENRGLATGTMGGELAIANPGRIDAVLRRIRPWAVIDAAGHPCVDSAEADPASCWRDNVSGPVNLAAACRRRGLPLVTFSSDLVFDGSSGRPYAESDTPSPLNVYGMAKAEAERRVLALLPEALVIRTSAFFGTGDDNCFATTLLRHISAGRAFSARDDCTVSPTYVPHLLHAVLDLLIDGERGIWHLVNDGAVTWYEFGRVVAARTGCPAELVSPCGPSARHAANRPSYSVLRTERGQLLPPLERGIEAYAADVVETLAEGEQRRASS